MNVLVAYECSGVVRDAFDALGHRAWSADYKPSERPGRHYQGPVRHAVAKLGAALDLLIAHPDCTYLAVSGLHHNRRDPERQKKTEASIEEVKWLLELPIPFIAIENPIGCLSTRVRKPDQIIQPYQFGEDASKATCLWLVGLPRLVPTRYVEPRMVNGRPRWANQTDSGQNKGSNIFDSRGRSAENQSPWQGRALAPSRRKAVRRG